MRIKILSVILLLGLVPMSAAWAYTCGDAYFNHDINWPGTSSLYFTVAGAPPNTCGDLYANRNGGGYQLNAAGWICTDSNGTATKGPWSSNLDDETAYVYVDWGTCTSPIRKHIWDVDPPTSTITSSCPSGFSGSASDDTWGAGFDDDWTVCEGEFYNETAGRWWNPSTSSYSSTFPIYVNCTCIGMPSMNITWSCSSKPDLNDHVAGNDYLWRAWVHDGGQWNDVFNDPGSRCEFTY